MKLHEIFEQVVRENPQGTSIKFQGKQLTNAEVNDKANKLANYLIGRINGTKGQQPVIGVHLKPSENPLIAMLAISKLGGIYVPLDTAKDKSIQDKYLTGICQDSKVQAIISEGDLTLSYNCPKVYLDKERDNIAAQNGDEVNPLYNVEENEQIAYYCYSSGTTGSPKGIPIRHAGLGQWYEELKELQSKDNRNRVILSHIAIGFDAHIWEYIMAWALNGSLCVAKQESTTQDLADLMETEEVTDATLVPAILGPIASLSSPPRKNNLNIYSTGSELTKELTEKCIAQGYRVYNCYGPTEATFGLTWYEIKPTNEGKALEFYVTSDEESGQRELAPMGKARFGDVEIFILDENNKIITGANRTGRLAYASPYMTSGYIGKDEETNKNFINIQELNKNQTVRVHRTDDICTIQNNNLYFIKRVGNNLKIDSAFSNGDNIKKYLNEHLKHKISFAEVVSFNGPPPYAIAFYQPKDIDHPLQLNDVYQLVRAQFGNQAAIPYLQAIQTVPYNNKRELDAAVLKLMAQKVSRDSSRQYNVPTTTLQKELVAIWAEILEKHGIAQKEIGITDDFGMFGTSMDRRTLLEKVNAKYKTHIDTASIWENDFTINSLEQLVKDELNTKFGPQMEKRPSENGKNLPPFVLYPSIVGDGPREYGQLFTQLKSAGVVQAVYSFKAPGLIDPSYNNLTLQQLIDHYYSLHKKMQPTGPYYLGGWSSGALIAYGVAQKLKENDDEVRSLILIDEAAPPKSAKDYDQVKFANDLFELVKHLPANIGPELTLENLRKKNCTEQVEFVFKNITPKQHVDPKAEDTLTVVKQFLLGQLKHDFKPISDIDIQVFYSDKTLKNNENNEKLHWDHYGNVTKNVRVGEDHFSIIQQPRELAEEIGKQIKLIEHNGIEKLRLDDKQRSGSNASSSGASTGSLTDSTSSGLSVSPPGSTSTLEETENERIANERITMVHRLLYQTVTKAIETPCNALTILKLLQIMIEWYASALDKIASESNVSQPIPQECQEAEQIFNKAVSGILKRLEEKAFTTQKLPEWLSLWILEVTNVISTQGLNKKSEDLQSHIFGLQKISYHDGTEKLDTEIGKLKEDKKVQEFLELAKQSGEAIRSLKKGDTKPFYTAITSRASALNSELKSMPETEFNKSYTFNHE